MLYDKSTSMLIAAINSTKLYCIIIHNVLTSIKKHIIQIITIYVFYNRILLNNVVV